MIFQALVDLLMAPVQFIANLLPYPDGTLIPPDVAFVVPMLSYFQRVIDVNLGVQLLLATLGALALLVPIKVALFVWDLLPFKFS